MRHWILLSDGGTCSTGRWAGFASIDPHRQRFWRANPSTSPRLLSSRTQRQLAIFFAASLIRCSKPIEQGAVAVDVERVYEA